MINYLKSLFRRGVHDAREFNTSVWDYIEEYFPAWGGRHRDGVAASDILWRLREERRAARRRAARRLAAA